MSPHPPPEGPPDRQVLEVAACDTYELRRAVLRTGTRSTQVEMDGDDEATTVHLAVVECRHGVDEIVAVSTWLRRPWPAHPAAPAVQLRGMATAPDRQGDGLGRLLLGAGLERAWRNGAHHVWANARDTALGFYTRHGFTVVGDGWVDATTGLPHHLVVRALRSIR